VKPIGKLDGNFMITNWEHQSKSGKKIKICRPSPKEKDLGILPACGLVSLAAGNLCS
jgi:hypothetical protein